jgi:signal transduction histidine kinase
MDERMIEQVLINLIKNALDAVQPSKEKVINLSCGKFNKEQVITVSDSGTGISKDQLDNIFIPFYSTRAEGSGIGLSFSQHVMRLHQGRINVRSNPGKGSQFQLVFK